MMNDRYAENISAEEIHLLDRRNFEGEIILVDNLISFKDSLKRLRGNPVLGFDTETRPSFRKGRKNKVSLIQLATGNCAVLFRINRIGIPDELVSILADPSIIKTGVALSEDLKALKNISRFSPEGFIDLQTYVKTFGIQSSGLKKLTAIVLGFRISKNQQVTDWEAETLSEAQQVYAATDAWVCHEIYARLNGRKSRDRKTG